MELLEEAGFKDVNGDGFVENPDGSEINFDIHVVNGWTDWVQTVQMVSEFLAEVGIKANTKTVDWSVYDSALKEGTIKHQSTGREPTAKIQFRLTETTSTLLSRACLGTQITVSAAKTRIS